jgi:uncharacterized membrane protein
MYWVWHRGVFTQVQFIDRNATWLNLLFLLPVSLIPFAASTLGEHSGDPTALHIYGAVLITATLMRMPLLSYLHHHLGLMWETSPQKSRRLETAVSASPLIVYVIAMLMASSRPTLSLVLYFLLPILYFALVAFLKADPRTKAHAEDLS